MNLDDLNRELRAKHMAGFGAKNSVEFGRDQQPVEASANVSRYPYGSARPPEALSEAKDLPFRYPWTEIYDTLQKMAVLECDPWDGALQRYVHPNHDGAPLRTMG